MTMIEVDCDREFTVDERRVRAVDLYDWLGAGRWLVRQGSGGIARTPELGGADAHAVGSPRLYAQDLMPVTHVQGGVEGVKGDHEQWFSYQ